MKNIFRTIELLEKNGFYKTADILQNKLIQIAAWPGQTLDTLPMSARSVDFNKNIEDFNQYDDLVWKELKQRIPDYRSLNTDQDEKLNMEGELNGPDPVPGPAYVYPEGGAQSPSMAGDLDYFTWDEARDANEGPEYWKNLVPRK